MWKLWNMSLWKILNSLINHSEPRDILFHECPRFQPKIYSLPGWKRGHVNKMSYRNRCLSLLDIWVITGLRRLKVVNDGEKPFWIQLGPAGNLPTTSATATVPSLSRKDIAWKSFSKRLTLKKILRLWFCNIWDIWNSQGNNKRYNLWLTRMNGLVIWGKIVLHLLIFGMLGYDWDGGSSIDESERSIISTAPA